MSASQNPREPKTLTVHISLPTQPEHERRSGARLRERSGGGPATVRAERRRACGHACGGAVRAAARRSDGESARQSGGESGTESGGGEPCPLASSPESSAHPRVSEGPSM
ncbi:hypothetical protein GUJ93_ZPchr0006g46469 [Zizania palustris]|uniref:Uncharacterized protein n=1 Tax=Zizania palustris TaxID=103762 RepID=A0A8J5VLF2_ZIZPA|nr:hypothetical protein GUJ93_ZPchr0006g46469 [Zizania palustris]